MGVKVERTSREGQRVIIIKDERPNGRTLLLNEYKAESLLKAVEAGNRDTQQLINTLRAMAKDVNPRMRDNNPHNLLTTWYTNRRGESYYCLTGENGLFLTKTDADLIGQCEQDFVNGLWYLAGSGAVVNDHEAQPGKVVTLPSGSTATVVGRDPKTGGVVTQDKDGFTTTVGRGPRTSTKKNRNENAVSASANIIFL